VIKLEEETERKNGLKKMKRKSSEKLKKKGEINIDEQVNRELEFLEETLDEIDASLDLVRRRITRLEFLMELAEGV